MFDYFCICLLLLLFLYPLIAADTTRRQDSAVTGDEKDDLEIWHVSDVTIGPSKECIYIII